MNSKTDLKKITNFIKELKEFKEDTQGQLHKLKMNACQNDAQENKNTRMMKMKGSWAGKQNLQKQ